MDDPVYLKYFQLVPNRIIPDISILFAQEEKINEIKDHIFKFKE